MSNENTIVKKEPSLIRWIITIAVGFAFGYVVSYGIGLLFGSTLRNLPIFQEGGTLAEYYTYIVEMIVMGGFFLGTVIAIKLIARKSLKAFILNSDRSTKVDIKKEVLPIIGLYLLGALISIIPDFANIEFTGKSMDVIVILIVFSLLIVWMQTSWEEFIFRGFPLRAICKDNIGLNKKSLIVATITSLIFMAAHISNPEVQTLEGIQAVFMTLSYFVSGFCFFLSDLLVGNLLPGLVIHWINNFYCIMILSQEVSVAGSTSIWVDHTAVSGLGNLVITIVTYAPVIIYLAVKRKNTK